MDAFSYLSVLISIVLGFALTEVLKGLVGVIRARREAVIYWPALAWAGFSIGAIVQSWWASFGLRDHHREAYTRVGRWILALALFVGVGLAFAAPVPEAAIAVILAFIAGGVVLNVLKEELPEERESRFWAFALGSGLYAVILLLTR